MTEFELSELFNSIATAKKFLVRTQKAQFDAMVAGYLQDARETLTLADPYSMSLFGQDVLIESNNACATASSISDQLQELMDSLASAVNTDNYTKASDNLSAALAKSKNIAAQLQPAHLDLVGSNLHLAATASAGVTLLAEYKNKLIPDAEDKEDAIYDTVVEAGESLLARVQLIDGAYFKGDAARKQIEDIMKNLVFLNDDIQDMIQDFSDRARLAAIGKKNTQKPQK